MIGLHSWRLTKAMFMWHVYFKQRNACWCYWIALRYRSVHRSINKSALFAVLCVEHRNVRMAADFLEPRNTRVQRLVTPIMIYKSFTKIRLACCIIFALRWTNDIISVHFIPMFPLCFVFLYFVSFYVLPYFCLGLAVWFKTDDDDSRMFDDDDINSEIRNSFVCTVQCVVAPVWYCSVAKKRMLFKSYCMSL